MSDRIVIIGTAVLLAAAVGGLGYVQNQRAQERIVALEGVVKEQGAQVVVARKVAEERAEAQRKEFAEQVVMTQKNADAKSSEFQKELVEKTEKANKELAERVETNQKAAIVEVMAAVTETHQKLQAELAKVQADTNAKVASGVDLVEKYVGGQNAILDRALGKYIPIQMPINLEAKIATLEVQGSDPSKWPADAKSVDDFSKALGECIRATPVWAERDMMPRFNILRWEAAALRVLVSVSTAKDQVTLGESCDGVLDAAFEGCPDEMESKLKGIKVAVEGKMRDERNVAVMQAAKDALEGKGDAAKAWDGLGYLAEAKEGKALELQQQLRLLVLNKNAEAQVDALKKDLERVGKISDWQLRQTGYHQIGSVATQQVLAWTGEEGIEKKKLEAMGKICKASADSAEAISKGRYLDYQRWALTRIKKMDDFIKNRAQMKAWKITMDGGVKGSTLGLGGTTQAEVDEAKGKYDAEVSRLGFKEDQFFEATTELLIPINPGLLDQGVNAMYQRVWGDAWKKAEDEKIQEKVAKLAATISKKGLGDELSQ